MEAIILAGGFGTRLKNVVNDVPKPMAPVNNKPFLSYILKYLKKYDIDRVILCTGYLSDKIEKFYGKEFEGVKINYSIEKEPLGTGGAIKRALKLCSEDTVIVINGDTFFDVNLTQLKTAHINHNADLTLSLKPMTNFDRYGIINIEQNGQIAGFEEKKHREFGNINGGVYALKRNIFDDTTLPEKFSLETDFFEDYFSSKKFAGFISDTYFIDIGIPEDYYKAQEDFKILWK
ncbi:MAG TPA: D-glycero-D-manno-heptose 1-phosphate guanosyltransferase [Bacteroidetes bacterium]|nr:D-glycero-D-manno-heptose 1-phosphate guanosyltransferase [Bacteroidota bacterium]